MQLTLCLPGLLLPRQALIDTVLDLELPALMGMLGKGRLRHSPATTPHVRLMQRCNLHESPTAALRLLGEGGDPGAHAWLCLDPVHLDVERRGVKLADPAALALSPAEDAALRDAVAPLFADVGALSGTVPGHWYLRLAGDCDLVAPDLPDAIGQRVDPALPGGADGTRWRTLLAEAQTVLYEHPDNRSRDAADRAVVNQLWPWGAGRLAAAIAAPFDEIWTGDAVLRGLARAARMRDREPPPHFEIAVGSNVVAILDDLTAPARSFDALAWREALGRVERDWIAPAAQALRQGRCKALRIMAFGPDASLDIDIARSDLLKFWRRPQPLSRLAA